MKKLKSNHQGGFYMLLVIIIFTAVIFITGIFVWQEKKLADKTNEVWRQSARLLANSQEQDNKESNEVDWQTYNYNTNTLLGYSLQYPPFCSYMQKNDQGDEVVSWVCTEGQSNFAVRYRINSSDGAKNQWFGTPASPQLKSITIGGRTGSQFVNYNCGIEGCQSIDIAYVVKYQYGLLGLEFSQHSDLYDESKEYVLGDLEQQIISTFKFTDQFSCTQDSDCVAISNPSNACYKSYFHKDDVAAIEQFKKTQTTMIQDCPLYGPAVCRDYICQAEFIKR